MSLCNRMNSTSVGFFVVRFILLYKEALRSDHSYESYMNQYFQVGLFIKVLHKMVLSFESVDDMLQYDHSNKSY